MVLGELGKLSIQSEKTQDFFLLLQFWWFLLHFFVFLISSLLVLGSFSFPLIE